MAGTRPQVWEGYFDFSDVPFETPPIVGGLGSPPAAGRQLRSVQPAAPAAVTGDPFGTAGTELYSGGLPPAIQQARPPNPLARPSLFPILRIQTGGRAVAGRDPLKGLAAGPGMTDEEMHDVLVGLVSFYGSLLSLGYGATALAGIGIRDVLPGLPQTWYEIPLFLVYYYTVRPIWVGGGLVGGAVAGF